MVKEYNFWCGSKEKKANKASNVIEFAQIKKDGLNIEELENRIYQIQQSISVLQLEMAKIKRGNRILLIGEIPISTLDLAERIENLEKSKTKLIGRIETALNEQMRERLQ